MQKISSLLLALIACAGTMFAQRVQIGDLYYNLNAEDLTAEVTSMPSGYYTGGIIIPASVEYNSSTYSVTSIGDGAFFQCSGLTSIEIPNSVTSIGNGAFFQCSGLTSITIPNSVTSIGEQAFYHCTGLTSVTIGNSVTSIGGTAFAFSGLTSIEIPNSVTSISGHAFLCCTGLTSIEIPNSVTNIEYEAFYGCSGLTSIVVASGNTTYNSRENCNAIIETATNTLIAGCKSTIIPNSVTSIGEGAFSGCSGLTSIEIPNSVTSIGEWAFASCTGLTSIEIPNSVISIGDYAFWGCSGLTSVTNYATTPQTIESNVFVDVDLSSCTLYVPEGSIGLYKAAEVWKDFINIQAIDTEDIDQIQLNSTVKNHKILYNGNVYILTGDKTYTVTGQQLK